MAEEIAFYETPIKKFFSFFESIRNLLFRKYCRQEENYYLIN